MLKIKAEETYDVLQNCQRWQTNIHNHGFVALIDVMPRLVPINKTADYAVVQAARVSYGSGTKKVNEDTGLVRYLMRHDHTTPTEMVEFKFHISAPIFVARQWLRHRMASVNEYSGRYSVMEDKYYVPDDVRLQNENNRQGGDVIADNKVSSDFLSYLDELEQHYSKYQEFISNNISREQARIVLPVSVYTQWYWKIDLHNLFNFLRLRMDDHAQKEIRDYATAIYDMIKEIVPISVQAFDDYVRFAVKLTKLEIEALKTGEFDSKNKREKEEWIVKKKLLT